MSSSTEGLSSAGPRVLVLDCLRLAAMLLMIQGHTLDALMDPALVDLGGFPWRYWAELRGLTAPLFMLVSGAATVLGIRYEADGRPSRAMLRRRVWTAVTVTGIGYLMVFPADRLVDLPWVSAGQWRASLQVHILQLNGAALLLLTALLARVRTVRRYAAWSLGLGVLILLAAPAVAGAPWFRWLPEGLAAFLSFEHGSTFPLFPTSAYLFLGVGLGALAKAAPERLPLACLGGGAGSLLVALAAGRLAAGPAGYRHTFGQLGCTLLLAGLLGWAVARRPGFAARWAPLGRHSLLVYVGHLVLIFGTPWTVGLATGRFHGLGAGAAALWVPLVGGATFAAMLLWVWIRRRTRHLAVLVPAAVTLALACGLVW